jgi:phospholipid transport system substrate-binding protein
MPDATAAQKIDPILAQPLTESCLTWLIQVPGRASARGFAAGRERWHALRREPESMQFPVTTIAPRRSLVRAMALACAAIVALPVVAMAQAAPPAAQAAPPAAQAAAPTAQAAPPAAAEAAPVVRKESPAGFMKRVGNELLAASRSGSVGQFAMVLNSNADVPSIGISALGEYARSLPKTDRPIYYNGMINFIARYASKEAPKYPVARFIVTAQSKEDARGTYVDSRITLASGDGYDVRWLIVKRGNTYKVRDAQVIGFWMTSFLDNLFQSFISDNGGNPKALVVALNR